MAQLKLPRGFSRRGAQIMSIATLVALSASGDAYAQGRAAPVEVARAEYRQFTETAPILARLVAPTQARLATRVAGIIDEVHVEVGDRVKEGDPVARLDSELLQIEKRVAEASLAQADAAIRVANANLEIARQSFARMENLQSSVAFSRARFEDLLKEAEAAKGSLAEAEARKANAQAALARAEYNLRNTEIHAAVNGVVIARDVEPGAFTRIGDPIVTILNDNDLEIEADIPTEVVGSVKPGLEIRITLDDGTDHKARVRALIPNESLSTRTRPVRLDPSFGDLRKPLAAGQSATIHVPFGAGRDILTVPKDALVQSRGGWIVYIAEDGKAQPRPVTIGAAVEDRFEVISGVAPDALVVTRGNERLRPGQAITFKESRSEPEKPAAPTTTSQNQNVTRGTGG